MSEQTHTSRDSLTGVWNGQFSYSDALQPGEFTATLLDFGGVLSGAIHEPDQWARAEGGLLYAEVSGRRVGSTVEFAKTYDGAGGWTHTVNYSGELSADGLEIEGGWDIPGEWSGRFLMIRAGRDRAGVELVAADTIAR